MTVEKISRDLLAMTCCKRERATAIDTSVAGDSLTCNRPPTSSWASFFLFSVCLHGPCPEVCHHFWWKHLIMHLPMRRRDSRRDRPVSGNSKLTIVVDHG